MLNQSVFESKPLSQIQKKREITPRLNYASELLDDFIESLTFEISDIEKSLTSSDMPSIEHIRKFSILSGYRESLLQVKQIIVLSKKIDLMPQNLDLATTVLRIVNSSLHKFSNLGTVLIEISFILGSILVDSAILTNSNVNFHDSFRRGKQIVDESKLIADSKISKLYPNLDFYKDEFV